MSEKHYPYTGGGFDRIIFDGDESVWVPEAENARLREELAKARDPQRIGGQADPSSFVYALEQLREFRWQHATNDEDAIPYINNVAAAHERENAKLHEDMEDLEAYDQILRDNLRQDNELRVKAEAENDKLREIAVDMLRAMRRMEASAGMDALVGHSAWFAPKLQELGIEVSE